MRRGVYLAALLGVAGAGAACAVPNREAEPEQDRVTTNAAVELPAQAHRIRMVQVQLPQDAFDSRPAKYEMQQVEELSYRDQHARQALYTAIAPMKVSADGQIMEASIMQQREGEVDAK